MQTLEKEMMMTTLNLSTVYDRGWTPPLCAPSFSSAANESKVRHLGLLDFVCREKEKWTRLIADGQNKLRVKTEDFVLPPDKNGPFTICIPLSQDGYGCCQVAFSYVYENEPLPVLGKIEVIGKKDSFEVEPHMLVDRLQHTFMQYFTGRPFASAGIAPK